MKVNFNGVEAPKNVGQTERVVKVIQPGVQELKILDVTVGSAKTGTGYVEVTFNKPENPVEYPLKDRFYLSPKSLWRLQHFLGEVLNRDFNNTEVDIEQLKPELVNKVNTYVVNGEEYLKPNPDGGTPYVNVRALLAFSNFINPPAGTESWTKKLEGAVAAANPSTDLPPVSSGDDDDLPF